MNIFNQFKNCCWVDFLGAETILVVSQDIIVIEIRQQSFMNQFFKYFCENGGLGNWSPIRWVRKFTPFRYHSYTTFRPIIWENTSTYRTIENMYYVIREIFHDILTYRSANTRDTTTFCYFNTINTNFQFITCNRIWNQVELTVNIIIHFINI